MILLGSRIIEEYRNGNISISPFDESRVGPNSYDLTLNNKLLRYTEPVLDMMTENPVEEILIPESGLVLYPGELYIGATNETATSKKYVPMLEGRSSIARLGIVVHLAAGFGDCRFGYAEDDTELFPTWTLEITVEKPVRIYANRRVCQAYFVQADGDLMDRRNHYRGKYSNQKDPQPSLLWKDIDGRVML